MLTSSEQYQVYLSSREIEKQVGVWKTYKQSWIHVEKKSKAKHRRGTKLNRSGREGQKERERELKKARQTARAKKEIASLRLELKVHSHEVEA